jgi:BirA family biotin operon repressor/biotin-[acetyl-CoA-carboxylase] ligase
MSVNKDCDANLKESIRLEAGGENWTLTRYAEVGSTNDLARDLPPWSAVCADVQTKGRGRFGRAFASGPGGLWISAVLPAGGPQGIWAGFSLRAGASLLAYLRSLGISGARLRWPNDLMCGSQKVGGLLIEQPASGILIVGFGLNICNQPWSAYPELREITTTLAEEMENPPSIMDAARGVLAALAHSHKKMLKGGMAMAIEELNPEWSTPLPVEIDLNGGGVLIGLFCGLDSEGHLKIRVPSGSDLVVEHHLVKKLRESP